MAAVILEPTGAHMGMEPVLPEFLHQLREVTERYGVVLIFDEVVTGFRTSSGGAQEYFGIMPDLTTLAKILGGGLPGGAVTGRADIVNMIEGRPGDADFNRNRRIAHNGTFNANPLSAAAGIAALKNRRQRADQRNRQRPPPPSSKTASTTCSDGWRYPAAQPGSRRCCSCAWAWTTSGDREYCVLPHDQMAQSMEPERVRQLTLSLINHGVQSGNRFVLTAAHTEDDIAHTIDACEQSLNEIREIGLI